MAQVKQEEFDEDDKAMFGSDQWLRQSVFDDNEEERKPKLLSIKCESEEDEEDRLSEVDDDDATEKNEEYGSAISGGDKTVSDVVGSLCVYRCKRCGTTHKTRSSLWHHFRKTGHREHGSDLSSYLIKRVLHKCQLCSKKILCDAHVILGHLRAHNISRIKDYTDLIGIRYKRYSMAFFKR